MISYFDGQIVAAAKRLSCHTLYTEDLNHRQLYDGVRAESVCWNQPMIDNSEGFRCARCGVLVSSPVAHTYKSERILR